MQLTPRLIHPAGALAIVGALLTWGGGAIRAQQAPPGARPAADTRTITHVLDRLGFGARPGDIERVQAMGLDAYIEAQLHPERLPNDALEARLKSFQTLHLDSRELAEDYFLPATMLRRQQDRERAQTRPAPAGDAPMMGGDAPAPRPAPPSPELREAQARQRAVVADLTQAKMLRAVFSERQLEEVLVDFWFNHFNVFIGKGQVRQYITEYEREAIRPHVLGSFRAMLGAVAHSPAMLFYLDNFQSATPNPPMMINENLERRLSDPRLTPAQREQLADRLEMQRRQMQARPRRGLNENYARELMELHTLGVNGGYTQTDVIELARILTGWTIDRPQQGGAFVFRPQMHDASRKVLLGTTFAPAGEMEGERALDLLASHPSTARHIAYKLAQRFAADEPPASLVDRAAATFRSTKGNLREVTRVIVTSPEFFAPEAYRGKVKTPLEFVASAVRATGAEVVNAQPLVASMQALGMPLYGCQPPTGYSMTADAWVNTGALLNRMNFAVQLVAGGRAEPAGARARGAAAGRGPGGGPGLAGGRGPAGRARGVAARAPLRVDIATLAPDTSEASRDRLVQTLLAGSASEATRQTLARATTPSELIALTLGSPEFQRR